MSLRNDNKVTELIKENSLYQYLKLSQLKRFETLLSIAFLIHGIAFLIIISFFFMYRGPFPFITTGSRVIAIGILFVIKRRLRYGEVLFAPEGILLSLLVTALISVTMIDNSVIALVSIYSSLIIFNAYVSVLYTRRVPSTIAYFFSVLLLILVQITNPGELIAEVNSIEVAIIVYTILTFLYLIILVDAVDITGFRGFVRNLVYTTSDSGIYNEYRLKDDASIFIGNKEIFHLIFIRVANYESLNARYQYAAIRKSQIKFEKRLVKRQSDMQQFYKVKDYEYVVLIRGAVDEASIIKAVKNDAALEADEGLYRFAFYGIKCPEHGRSIEEITDRVQTISYYRDLGSDQGVVWYSDSDFDDSLKKKNLSLDVESALENGDIFMVYQPIVYSSSQQISKVEILSRWQHEDYGFVPPSEFIPIVEEQGLLIKLTEFALSEGIELHKKFLEKHGVALELTVNVSTKMLISGEIQGIIERVFRDESKKISQFVTIEITEDSMMAIDDNVLAMIRALKKLGLKLAIDDFGTGFSNFEYLKNLDIDVLKIDKKFIDGIIYDSKSRVVTNAIIDMSHTLDLDVVAEGVEYLEQLEQLYEWQCDFIQGYYFSKPVKSEVLLSDFSDGPIVR